MNNIEDFKDIYESLRHNPFCHKRITIQQLYKEIVNSNYDIVRIIKPETGTILTENDFKEFKDALLLRIIQGFGSSLSYKLNNVYFTVNHIKEENNILNIICDDWMKKDIKKYTTTYDRSRNMYDDTNNRF